MRGGVEMISSPSETTLKELRQSPRQPKKHFLIDRRSGLSILLLLLLAAFAVDLLTPFLVWKGILPSGVRWLSDLAVAGVLVLTLVHILSFDHIPKAVLLILSMSLIGITVALFEGQSILATAWGWWLFFRYLFVGIFAYLQPIWPKNFARWLIHLCIVILTFEVVVQFGQYFNGEIPGDNLAGTFGRNGTASLIIFILFTFCLALGQWLTDGKWQWLAWTLVLGGISSVLGEIKLFPFVILALGVATLFIKILQGRRLHKLLIYLVLLGAVTLIFTNFYNTVVAEERGTRRLEEFLELQTLKNYLNFTRSEGGRYELGRGFALTLGWEIIQKDTTTFLFGMGLGARGESVALGIAGEGLRQSYYGFTSGTSLLVLMQELGVIGLAIIGGVILWIIITLARDIKLDPGSNVTILRYALILFSIGWPVWLWYTSVWATSVTMLLYWVTLGYVLARSPRNPVGLTKIRSTDPAHQASWPPAEKV